MKKRKTASGKLKTVDAGKRVFRFQFSALGCLRLSALILIFAAFAFAQDLPDEIRGYKVHKAKIAVSNQAGTKEKKDKSEALVRIGDPVLTDTSLTGLTFEISAVVDDLEQSGKVDFLTFRDFQVNGLTVEIEEYKESFEFRKNQTVNLPRPVKIFLGSREALRAALGELKDSKAEWTVTGRVFVFGRFKKFGFDFKRVVPVDVSVKIKNPLKNGNALAATIPSF